MFDLSDKIKDNFKDDVSPYLRILNKRKKWNSEAKEHLTNLEKVLKQKKYKSFVGSPYRYHLTRIGDSCLYDVPTYRKGALAEFRGKRIRVVCMSSGRYDRWLMAEVVGETPRNKIKIKEKIVFVFPEIGDHEIAYSGRRYMVIQSKGQFPIETYQGSNAFIDLESCDLILLDGKDCCPIATLKFQTENNLIGNIVGWTTTESYFSIAEAVKGLAKKNQDYKIFIEKFQQS
jgi:hypothetical protein